MVKQDSETYDAKGFASDFQNIVRIARWNYVGIAFIDFLLPYFSDAILSATPTEVGILLSSTLLGVIISSFVTGLVIKKVGSKRLMVLASIGRGCAYLGMYFAFVFGSVYALMVAAFVKGGFVGIFEVSFENLASEKSHKTNRSFAFGKIVSSKGIVLFTGGIIGFTVYGLLNYFNQMLFLQISPMVFFSVAMVWTGLRLRKKFLDIDKIPQNDEEQSNDPSAIVLNTNNSLLSEKQDSNFGPVFLIGVILIFISLFLTSVNDFITHPFIQLYLLDVLSADFWMILIAYTPGAIISYILAPQFGKIADRINPYWGIAIVSIGGALLTFWLINVTHIWMFGVIFLLDRGFALTGALLVKSFVSRISISKRGRNIGFSWSISQIGGIIGPVAGGLLWDGFNNPQMPFIVSIFVELGLIAFYIAGIYMTRNRIEESLEK